MMTIQEQDAYFMRKAAIHECGHATVASHYGIAASPSIWLNTSETRDEEVLWLGTTRLYELQISTLRYRRIALAGKCAEWFDSEILEGRGNGIDAREMECLIIDSMDDDYDDNGEWSRLDWMWAQGWKSRDVQAVQRILTHNWSLLVQGAEVLMARATENGFCSGDPRDAVSYAHRNP